MEQRGSISSPHPPPSQMAVQPEEVREQPPQDGGQGFISLNFEYAHPVERGFRVRNYVAEENKVLVLAHLNLG